MEVREFEDVRARIRADDHADSRRSTMIHTVLAIALVFLAVISRLFEHPANFTPVAAVALFSGVYLPRRWGWILPLVVMLASDAIIGFYQWQVMASVYASFLVIVAIGWYVRRQRSIGSVLLSSLSGSVLFFLATNAATWAWGNLYPPTAQGLFTAYVMGIPFFKNTLAGDLFYTTFLFGAFEAIGFLLYVSKRRIVNVS